MVNFLIPHYSNYYHFITFKQKKIKKKPKGNIDKLCYPTNSSFQQDSLTSHKAKKKLFLRCIQSPSTQTTLSIPPNPHLRVLSTLTSKQLSEWQASRWGKLIRLNRESRQIASENDHASTVCPIIYERTREKKEMEGSSDGIKFNTRKFKSKHPFSFH